MNLPKLSNISISILDDNIDYCKIGNEGAKYLSKSRWP